MIYTSGSTGKPKGAANTHAGLHNRLAWMQDAYGLTAADVVLQKTPFSFDVSVWEFFWPLITGARLVLAAPGAHRDPAQLVADDPPAGCDRRCTSCRRCCRRSWRSCRRSPRRRGSAAGCGG